ncbi:MAG: ergothioneine biosynthesis protein EgtC [Actinomycetota bacterium]
MCRLLAYQGPARTLESVLVDPPHSLYHQAYAPRDQVSGSVNADGFGVGWYDLERRPEPAVHKSARSIWADRSFSSFAGLVASPAFVAVVRGATAPAPVEDSGAQPFASGRWLFAHNGAVEGYRTAGVAAHLRRALTAGRESQILSASDSEVLFALALDRMDDGEGPAEALASVIDLVESHRGGRMNLVMTDGRRLVATRWGDALSLRSGDDGTHIASEPFDDDDRWASVPDHHLVDVLDGSVEVRPLPHP